MSTTSGTSGGRNFVIAPMPCASPMSKQEIRTISQPASSMRRISVLVSSVSLVAVVVSDCTQIGWPPPMTSFPQGTSRVLWRGTILLWARRVKLQPASHDDEVLLPVWLDALVKIGRDGLLLRRFYSVVVRFRDVEGPVFLRRVLRLARRAVLSVDGPVKLRRVDHDLLGDARQLVPHDLPSVILAALDELSHLGEGHRAEDLLLVVGAGQAPLVRAGAVVSVVGLAHEAAREKGRRSRHEERFHGRHFRSSPPPVQCLTQVERAGDLECPAARRSREDERVPAARESRASGIGTDEDRLFLRRSRNSDARRERDRKPLGSVEPRLLEKDVLVHPELDEERRPVLAARGTEGSREARDDAPGCRGRPAAAPGGSEEDRAELT